MSNEEKLSMLKTLLNENEAAELPSDDLLNAYLIFTETALIGWLYSYKKNVPADAKVPPEYEMIQIQACIVGWTISGAEGQATHSENGISRSFKYTDAINYIHTNVFPYAGVL